MIVTFLYIFFAIMTVFAMIDDIKNGGQKLEDITVNGKLFLDKPKHLCYHNNMNSEKVSYDPKLQLSDEELISSVLGKLVHSDAAGQVIAKMAYDLNRPNLSHKLTDHDLAVFAKTLFDKRMVANKGRNHMDIIREAVDEALLPLYSTDDHQVIIDYLERLR